MHDCAIIVMCLVALDYSIFGIDYTIVLRNVLYIHVFPQSIYQSILKIQLPHALLAVFKT